MRPLLLIPFLLALPAHAMPIRSGTGFFVSKYGEIITNAHVVDGCETVTIRGAVEQTQAEVVDVDADIDLALLKTDAIPPYVASVRYFDTKIKKGDDVIVMGYPGESARTGEYKVVESHVFDTAGPTGEAKWLQFEDAAQQGNSGGPLLDRAGNVIGVVAAKSVLNRLTASGALEFVQSSDVAISLPYLTEFLDAHNIVYWKMYSGLYNSTDFIEQTARDYIVNIHCQLE